MKRGNDYFMMRLINEFPSIYAEYLAGKFASKRAAFIAAGLMKERSRVNAIVQAIRNASLAEVRAAVAIIKGSRVITILPVLVSVPISIVDKDQRLTEAAITEIKRIFLVRKLKPGQAMTEMGLNSRNQSISNALTGGRIRDDDTIKKLADWMDLNK